MGTVRSRLRHAIRQGKHMHVLVIDGPGSALPAGTAGLLSDIGWHVIRAADFSAAAQQTATCDIDAAILSEPSGTAADSTRGELEALLRLFDSKRIAAVVLSDRPPAQAGTASLINVVDSRISPAELRGQLTMIERYHGLLKRVEGELHNMERLSRRLRDHFQEVDEELRLAARLQLDFLPDLSRPFGSLRAAAIYRPASWVSGDIFDVIRIDPDHTGVYIVDAVGHGMSASLLTMFIKRAVTPAYAYGDDSRVLTPGRVMSALNEALADQSLPNCQFVTAAYGLFHHSTRRFQYARGGHPYPLHISPAGVAELQTPGGLLGLAKGESFCDGEVVLAPGDKVLFYSDGVEGFFGNGPPTGGDVRAFQSAVRRLAALPLEEMMGCLEVELDSGATFAEPRDDLTILALEVLSSP